MSATGQCLLAGFCKYGHESNSATISFSIYPSVLFLTAVAVFRKPNAIPEKLQVVVRGTLTRYGGYRGNKIPGVDQN